MRHIPALALTTLLIGCLQPHPLPDDTGGEEWEPRVHFDEGDVCASADGDLVSVTVVVNDCLSSSCSRDLEGSCTLELAADDTLVLQSDISWEVRVDPATCTDDCGTPSASCELAGVPDGTYTLSFDGQDYEVVVPGDGPADGCWPY